MSKNILLFIVISTIVILSGCSATVTERVPYGSRLIVDINYSSDVNFSENKYYMVIAENSDYVIPLAPDYEFIEPFDDPIDEEVDYYQFYSTWSGYIVIDAGNAYLVKGPFISTSETYSRISIGQPLEVASNISFQFILEEIFGSDPPDNIYFDFVSVNSSNYLQDHLLSSNNSIIRYNGMIVTGSDEGKPEIDPSLDILNWAVSIQ